jgi:hypothetical protein
MIKDYAIPQLLPWGLSFSYIPVRVMQRVDTSTKDFLFLR